MSRKAIEFQHGCTLLCTICLASRTISPVGRRGVVPNQGAYIAGQRFEDFSQLRLRSPADSSQFVFLPGTPPTYGNPV